MNYLVPRRYHTIKLGPESRVRLATKHYKCKFSSLLNDVSLKLYIDGVKSRKDMNFLIAHYKHGFFSCRAGLHKLWYPGIRDMSTWSKFGAHGEHGDVFLFSNLGAL